MTISPIPKNFLVYLNPLLNLGLLGLPIVSHKNFCCCFLTQKLIVLMVRDKELLFESNLFFGHFDQGIFLFKIQFLALQAIAWLQAIE